MKYFSCQMGIGAITFVLFIFLFGNYASLEAVSPIPKSSGIKVKAQVGSFQLHVAGIATPLGVVSLLAKDKTFLISTIADEQGRFDMTPVLINEGFDGFCMSLNDQVPDRKSQICQQISPAVSNVEIRNLFLPPTLGLSSPRVNRGFSVKAVGYTMPQAQVTLTMDQGRTMYAVADSNGYYMFDIGGLGFGEYKVSVTARYQDMESLKPETSKTINVLALALGYTWTYWIILILLILLIILFLLWRRRKKKLEIRN